MGSVCLTISPNWPDAWLAATFPSGDTEDSLLNLNFSESSHTLIYGEQIRNMNKINTNDRRKLKIMMFSKISLKFPCWPKPNEVAIVTVNLTDAKLEFQLKLKTPLKACDVTCTEKCKQTSADSQVSPVTFVLNIYEHRLSINELRTGSPKIGPSICVCVYIYYHVSWESRFRYCAGHKVE